MDRTRAQTGSSDELLDAVLAIASDLDLPGVLERLVEAAADLTGARYVALGVIGTDGRMTDVVTTGTDLGTATGRGQSFDVPIRIRGTVFGTLALSGKRSGGSFRLRDRQHVIVLSRAAALVIENARAYGLSERRRQLLEASASLADALQPPIGVVAALQEVVLRARALAGATTCVLVQFPEDAHPVIAASDSATGQELPPIIRRILDELRIVEDREVAVDIDLGDSWALAIPVLAHLSDPGALVLITPTRPTYEAREMLLGYVDQAGLALDRVQALTERQELAVVSERARIGRDLHDVVIQRLFAAGLTLQSLASAHDPEGFGAQVAAVVADLDATIHDIRTTIFGLQDEPDRAPALPSGG